MQSLRHGFSFLQQSWQMVLADRDLILPSIFALLIGFMVTLVGSVPIILAFMFLGKGSFGQVVGYILGAILVFLQYLVSYIFAAMTVYLIYGYLAEGDGRLDRAWTLVRRDFLDILSLAAASTVVNLLKNLVRGRGRRGGRNFLADIIDTVWTEATYLVLPAMVIEDIGLQDSLKRATQIVRNNLLLVGVSTVGIKLVNGLIGFLLGAVGIGLGLGVSLSLISFSGSAPLGYAIGIGSGVVIAGFFIMLAVVMGSYTATAYHTCLYLWARDVEQAGLTDMDRLAVSPPAPLAAALK